PFSTDTTPAIPEPRRRLTATSLPSIDRAGAAAAEPIVTAGSTQHPDRPSMPLRKTSDQGSPVFRNTWKRLVTFRQAT
ncbi:hypothetical protein, partial [Burkholderia anthina]|uniref:hypothetical protein n=1 Tax=Burkholderia anthina TaxID=179879 RepID=UPI001ABA325B